MIKTDGRDNTGKAKPYLQCGLFINIYIYIKKKKKKKKKKMKRKEKKRKNDISLWSHCKIQNVKKFGYSFKSL